MLKTSGVLFCLAVLAAPAAPQTPPTGQRFTLLASTNTHGNEMYGTMAVYLRLKGLVPPTTARQNQQKPSPREN